MSTTACFYVYVLFRENGDPFYIGKGKDDRWRCHERHARADTKSHKSAIIRGIHARGFEVIKAKIHEGLTEAIAHNYEVALIAAIGRGDDGPLVNRTDGGDGVTGMKHAGEARLSISKAHRGRQKPPEECANIAAGKLGSKASAAARANMSAAHIGKTPTPETRAKISASHRGKKHSPEHVAKLAAIRRGIIFSPEWRANLSAAHRGIKLSDEHCANLSAAKRGKPWSAARRAAYELSRASG